ncbi:putative lipid II flippase FtsW [Paracoccus litorisediminis]|uniref:putative lipid II flippase FtsW n=1 Tax=Paracoccus litorisediminis TaxID=2006130 RepID=UPI00372FA003
MAITKNRKPPKTPHEPLLSSWWTSLDRWTLFCIFSLFAIGILLGLAASVPLAERNGLPQFYYVTRQAIFGLMAMMAMLVTSMLPPRRVRRLGVLFFGIAIALILVLPFIGTDFGKGAVRWLRLPGGMSIQPSEFLKPCFVIVCAWFMAASQELGGPPGRAYSFLVMAITVVLLAMQPDFGQASLILFSWCVMFFVAGAPMVLLFGVIGIAGTGGLFAYEASEHFARRINGFLASEVDPRTQIGYATNAIQEGGYFGVGVGEGSVKWSLPDAHTDFIIAVAAEEYGLVLVLIIMALYLTIVLRSMARLRHERDPFARLAGAGLAAAFGVQAMINMGVAVRLLPAKGMTLPFVSYGGSSVIASGIAVGMLLAMTRQRPQSSVGDRLRQIAVQRSP